MKTNHKLLLVASIGYFFNLSIGEAQTLNYVTKWNSSGSLVPSLIFDDGTNVGIGTSSPAFLLSAVKNQNGVSRIAISNNNTGSSAYAIFHAIGATGGAYFGNSRAAVLGNSAGTEVACIQASAIPLLLGTANSHELRFVTNAIERVRVTSSGSVGIGTTSPDIASNGSAYKTLSILGPNTSAYSCGILELATQSTDANGNIAGVVNFTASSNASTQKSIAQITAWTQGTTATNRGGTITFTTKPDGATATIERMRITSAGNVGIGTDLTNNPNNYKFAVNGTIGAKAVKVEISSTTWPDFVFSKEYKLKNIKEVEKFIKQNGHLPEIPTAKEIEANGADLAELLKLQMQKIEELTLYIIEQDKRIEALERK